MTLSPYFHNLRTAYRAELDDLTSDSEGKDVLQKRLTQKRKEIGFLVQMLELSPEHLEEVEAFLAAIDGNDDVQNVFVGLAG